MTDTGGIILRIAENLGCTRKTVYNYINRFPDVKEAYEEEKERLLDMCEEGLSSLIYGRNLDAIRYYLGKKGQSRGYAEHSGQPSHKGDATKGIVESIRSIFSAD